MSATQMQARSEVSLTKSASETEELLTEDLRRRGVRTFAFYKVPPDYYDRDLEYRRACLEAPSIEHLCKTIVFENTKAHPSVDGCKNPSNSKYYCVIVQVRL